MLEEVVESPWRSVRNYLYGAAVFSGALATYFAYDLSEILQGYSSHDARSNGYALLGLITTSYVCSQLGALAEGVRRAQVTKNTLE